MEEYLKEYPERISINEKKAKLLDEKNLTRLKVLNYKDLKIVKNPIKVFEENNNNKLVNHSIILLTHLRIEEMYVNKQASFYTYLDSLRRYRESCKHLLSVYKGSNQFVETEQEILKILNGLKLRTFMSFRY